MIRVENSAPLILLFDEDAQSIAEQFRRLFSGPELTFFVKSAPSAVGEFSILNDGVSLTLRMLPPSVQVSVSHRIFTNYDVACAKCMIELSFNAHVAGGERIPPVVLSLLSTGAAIGKSLKAKAVFWQPANVLSETNYFAEAVTSYANGGAFPILSTIDFVFDEQNFALSTSGLAWFSGQELKLEGDAVHLGKTELARRAVRLSHDIAVNGPVLNEQVIPDFEPTASIVLTPDPTATRVVAKISSNVDQSSMAVH